MDDIVLTFDKNGMARELPKYCTEIYFETSSEMEEFGDFVNSGNLLEAFNSWKKGRSEEIDVSD